MKRKLVLETQAEHRRQIDKDGASRNEAAKASPLAIFFESSGIDFFINASMACSMLDALWRRFVQNVQT
jgi:hypothetical protein